MDRVPRRRGLAGAGLWVGVVAGAACSSEREVVSAPQGPAASPGGSMVPATTRELPPAHVATPAGEPEPAVKSGESAPATKGSIDPRAVPAGTPAAIARVFQRLPVAIHDGPPLGSIGASGIHVDKIWLGRSYEKDGCADETASFSLARDSQVNVCFRAVHSREEESVEVEWIKDGAPFRRRAVNIPDIHAYRSRAYLVLRGEYVGVWQARVLAPGDVVLASVEFTVTP